MLSPPRFLPLPLAAALLSLACGGGGAGGGAAAGPSTPLLPGALQLAFVNSAGQVPAIRTSLVLRSGQPLVAPVMAYLTAPAGGLGPVTLAAEHLPPDLAVAVDGRSADRFAVSLNDPHRLALTDRAGAGPGTLAFRLRASLPGQDRLLPVVITCGAAPFSILPPASPAVTVAPGQALTFPLHLWHADTYYASQDGAYPAYQGVTFLGCSGSLPPGLTVAFPDGPNPCDRSAAAVCITAGPETPPGRYALALTAVRVTDRAAAAEPLPLTVTVPAPADPPAVWIQDVAWGQGVVAPSLRLVGGRPALLKVVALADRPGLPAPAGKVRLLAPDGSLRATLPLAGPDQVPTAAAEGDLPRPGRPATAYTVVLPGSEVRPGLEVEVEMAGLPALRLAPAVATGLDLDLAVVPVVSQGLTPDLPEDGELAGALQAFWPLANVRLAHRAPYVTGVAWTTPGDPAGWAQLLAELGSLRILDGATANYYGFVNPGFAVPPGWAITGLSRLGEGVSVGIDRAAARFFQNPDPDRNLSAMVLVHELGHAFNLAHTPAGGAADPQLEYPYYGGSIGSWNYEPAAQAALDPADTADIMGYGRRPHGVSDWNYRNAMGFLEQRESVRTTALARPGGPEQWLVSGWVDPQGRVEVLPLVRAACPPAPPGPGGLELRLATAAGAARASFAADPVPDLPAGWRTFCFTVPAGTPVTGLEVRTAGRVAFQRRPADPAPRLQALAGSAPTLVEQAGMLHVRWDAGTSPYAHVFHEGRGRTTLALHLAGGCADLPLAGLEPGGWFVLQLTGGLEPVTVRVPRTGTAAGPQSGPSAVAVPVPRPPAGP